MRTRLTDLLNIRYPIIQGGLAHLAYAELCAAVSNAGGLGQITATSLPSIDRLREEIRRTRQLTDQPFAVNFAISERKADLLAWLDAAIDEGAPIATFTAGNPELFVRRAREANVASLVLTAAVRQAQKAEELGASAVIVVGQEGGGHIGRDDTSTIALTPRVVDAVRIPVVASGGLADGRGLAAAIALGADGIEMGTRFVATQECIAHPNYKAALVAATERDTRVISRSKGLPGRALPSAHVDVILAAEAAGVELAELLPLIGGTVNKRAALDGDLAAGYVWAGQGVGLINDIPTVADLIARTINEAKSAATRLASIIAPPD